VYCDLAGQLVIFAYVVALIMYISNESISSGWINGLICWIVIRTITIITSTISSSNDVVANATTRTTGTITDIDDFRVINVITGIITVIAVIDDLPTPAVVDAIAYDATATCSDANETSDAYDETSSWC